MRLIKLLFILILFTEIRTAIPQTIEVRCPTGDKYVCYQNGPLIVRKGEGEVVVIIQ